MMALPKVPAYSSVGKICCAGAALYCERLPPREFVDAVDGKGCSRRRRVDSLFPRERSKALRRREHYPAVKDRDLA